MTLDDHELRAIAQKSAARHAASGRKADAVVTLAAFRLLLLRAATDSERVDALVGICASRQLLFEHRGLALDLEDALECGEIALKLAGSTSLGGTIESNLANAHRLRYEHLTGSLDDLRAGLTHAWSSQRFGAATSIRGERLSNFGVLLRLRFERLGERADIDESIDVLESAIELVDESKLGRVCANAAVSWRIRGSRYGRNYDLTRALELAHHSVNTSPERSPNLAGFLLGEAWVLLDLYFARGELQYLDSSSNVLDRARGARRASNDVAPLLLAQATVARLVAERELSAGTANATHANAAVDAARVALLISTVGPTDRALHLTMLARALRLRFRIVGSQADAFEAIAVRRQSAEVETSAPFDRALSAYWVARWSMEDRNHSSAADAMTQVVDMLHQIVWLGLDRASRQRHLVEWAHVGSDAAAAALANHQSELAVALLEHGRNLLWQQAIGRPGEIERLAIVDHDLSQRLERLRLRLTAAQSQSVAWEGLRREVQIAGRDGTATRPPPEVAEKRASSAS